MNTTHFADDATLKRIAELERQRDELVEALAAIESCCHPVNTVYSWSEEQRKAVRKARAALAKVNS